MPKLICVDCEVKYRPDKNGIYLVEMAWEPPQPYKIWHADMWKCPRCSKQVVAGFGNGPLSEHYQDDFDDLLHKIIHAVQNDKAIMIYEFERASDKDGFEI